MQRRCEDTCTTAWRCCRCWMLPPPLLLPAQQAATLPQAVPDSQRQQNILRKPQQCTHQRLCNSQQGSRAGLCGCWTWGLAPGCRACCWRSAARTGR